MHAHACGNESGFRTCVAATYDDYIILCLHGVYYIKTNLNVVDYYSHAGEENSRRGAERQRAQRYGNYKKSVSRKIAELLDNCFRYLEMGSLGD